MGNTFRLQPQPGGGVALEVVALEERRRYRSAECRWPSSEANMKHSLRDNSPGLSALQSVSRMSLGTRRRDVKVAAAAGVDDHPFLDLSRSTAHPIAASRRRTSRHSSCCVEGFLRLKTIS